MGPVAGFVGTFDRGVSKVSRGAEELDCRERKQINNPFSSFTLSNVVEVKGAVAKKGVNVRPITSIVEGSVPITVA